ncbi:MAG: hypothetical protein SOZ34_02805, partial [Clostridia bacterium]|nr:hypothetical protein [Clostridia bacterium]
IIKNGVTDEVIKNVFGVYSTEYDKYRSIIDKAQAVEGMEYSDYESFKTAASEAIANYLNAPSVRDTVSKQSAYEINQRDTQYVYQYIDGEAVLDDEGNRKSISDSILGYGLADKFINQASAKLRFENLDEQFAYKAYVKKAVLEYTAWTGSGDIGKNAVNAAVAMKKTVRDDSEPVSDYMSGAEYIYESELVWNTAKTTADFPVKADITEDFKAASNLYYIVTPKRLCDENYVNFRFRQNPKITVTYMNSYDLYNEYKNSTDSTKKAEIIDVYAFVNDITLTENSADIVSTLNNAETFEQFEQIIKDYRPLDVILGEVAAVEAGGMSVTVKNNTNKDMPVFVIAAAYGTNNKLLTTSVFSNESGTVSAIAANAEENFSFSFADVEGVKNVRVFCWTDFNTIKPYCPSSDYSIE